ncbi:MAG: MFS transporter [Puniceicoccaceae bacterium]
MNASETLRLPMTFWWANFAQFGSALNDVMFKFIVIYALIAWQGSEYAPQVLASVGITLALPVILILPIAGSVADHFSKRSVIATLKVSEILILGFTVISLTLQNVALVYVSIVLMASHYAFFTPCKFAIIPELVGDLRLSRANGHIQLFTFLALLLGTLLAPRLSLAMNGSYDLALCFCIPIAVSNLICAVRIGKTPAHMQRKIRINGARMILKALNIIRSQRSLLGSVLAISLFSLIAVYCQMNIINYGSEHLSMSPEVSTYLFLVAAVGIGIGSLITGLISGKSIVLAYIPAGSAIMFACLAILGLLPDGALVPVGICMLVFGLGAGAYLVPLESYLQLKSPSDRIGSIKATNGLMNWVGILIASGLVHLFSTILELHAKTGFLLLSLLLFGLFVSTLWLHPDCRPKFRSRA